MPAVRDTTLAVALGVSGDRIRGVVDLWAGSEEAGLDTAHRLCANAALPGQLAQTLPNPQDFENAATLITRQVT